MIEEEISKNPRIALIGSVNSSRRVLEKFGEHKMNLVHVFGLDPEVSGNVSGYNDLRPYAEKFKSTFSYFEKINTREFKEKIKELDLDLLFVVGLSQLVDEELMSIPKSGCIGYHPTLLPEGRGRGAIAWIILGKVKPAATFFMLGKGADTGAIIAQEPVHLNNTEYPQEVIDKILSKIDACLDAMLPKIRNGKLLAEEQDEQKATYLGKRAPSDGYLDWSQPAIDLQRLVRAVSKPLPGAITFLQEREIKVWRSKVYRKNNIFGVVGRIVKKLDRSFVVQTGDGLLEVTDWEGVSLNELVEGNLLGINWVTLFRKISKTKS